MTDEKPKSLEDYLGTIRDKSDEEILRSDEGDKAEEALEQKKAANRTKRKVGLGVLSSLVVLSGIVVLNPWYGPVFGPSTTGGDGSSLRLDDSGTSRAPVTNEQDVLPWYEEEAVPPQVTIPEWAKTNAVNDASAIPDEVEEDARQVYRNTRLLDVTDAGLRQEDEGFTSDIGEINDPNGGLNLNFYYVTADVFLRESHDIVNRLINPVYGGWSSFETSSSNARSEFDQNLLSPITSERYQQANFGKPDKSYLPVLADWNGNSYGLAGQLINVSPIWLGEVTDADIRYEYDLSNVNYIYYATYQVRYTAWTVDREKITRDATLQIKFITDRSAVYNDSLYRIKIDEANLTFQ